MRLQELINELTKLKEEYGNSHVSISMPPTYRVARQRRNISFVRIADDDRILIGASSDS